MSRTIVCLPGDGIGPEVTAEAVRVLEALPLDVEIAEHAFGGAAIDAFGDPLPAETLAACKRRRRGAARRGRRPAVGRRPAAPRGRPDRPAQGARRLREPAPGGRRGRRPADRARAGRRPLLRRARRPRGRHGLRHLRVPPGPGRAGSRGARSSLPARRSGRLLSVDKANVLDTSRMWRRVVTELGERVPRRRAEARARRQRRDAARHGSVLVRHARDGEHVRRHPLRRRRRRDRRARPRVVREPRRLESRASSSRCTARRPTSPAPAPRTRPAMLRSLALLLEHGLGEPALARARRGGGDAARSRTTPTPDLGGTATTSEFGSAVLAALSQRGARHEHARRLPGPGRQPQRRRAAAARAPGVDAGAAVELHRRRRGGGRGRGRAGRAADRELAPRPGRARRTTCSTRRRSRSSPR